MKIAGKYDYQDPRDPSDTFDRFERPDYEARDKDGGSAERGQPFTDAEIDTYLEAGGAITICPTPVQPEPKLPGLTKMQEAWGLTFDPLAGLDDAMVVCREHINRVRATSGRDRDKASRIRNTIKGILWGMTFADVAAEMCLDRAFLSRTMADAYAGWPRLERPLTFINLLNNQARRKCGELSTAWQFALQRGEQISDEGVLIWGRWPGSGPSNHKHTPEHVVKLIEQHHRAFPPISSNYNTVLASIVDVARGDETRGEVTWEPAPSRGTHRVESVRFDAWKQEYDRGDGRVDIGAFEDYSDLHNAIDTWQRLRDHAGLPDKYFHEAIEGKACVWPPFDVGDLQWERALWAEARRFTDERWLAANYPAMGDAVFDGKSFAGLRAALERAQANKLSVRPYPFMAGIVLLPEPVRYKAPYVPFVNECKPSKKRSLHPSKYRAPKKSYKGKKLTTTRWAKVVHNATHYGPNADPHFKKLFSHLEPPTNNGEVKILGMADWTIKPDDQFDTNRDMIETETHCCVNARAAEALGIQQKQIAYNALLERPIELYGTIVEAGPYERVRRTAARCMPINSYLGWRRVRQNDLMYGRS